VPTPLIRESPSLTWDALQEQTVAVTLTPRTGLTVPDYGTVTLTIREDPEWPRSGATEANRHLADPIGDGWEIVATGSEVASTSPIEIDVTVPDGPGTKRYTVDVVADGGDAGRVTLVPTTYLSVRPTLKAS
jgi:hypothetical protein